MRLPPRPTLFPYPTLFRSHAHGAQLGAGAVPPGGGGLPGRAGGRRQGAPARAERRRLPVRQPRSEEHTSELQSREKLVCRLLLEKKKISTSTDKTRSTRNP